MCLACAKNRRTESFAKRKTNETEREREREREKIYDDYYYSK